MSRSGRTPSRSRWRSSSPWRRRATRSAVTQTHPDLALASQTVQTAEICGGRTDLISDGFKAPVSFAYPYGSFNASAETVANSCGFTHARTVSDGPESIPPAVPMATAAMPSVQAVANATDPAVTVAQMEGWVTGAESGNKKWVQVVWHDIVTQGSQAGDEYYQLTPDFTAFLDWLKGEATAGRAVVKTAGAAMGGAVAAHGRSRAPRRHPCHVGRNRLRKWPAGIPGD